MSTLGIGTMPNGRAVNMIGANTGIVAQPSDIPPTRPTEEPETPTRPQTPSGTQNIDKKDEMPSYMPILFIGTFLVVAYLVLKD